jgi:proteasome component ECM29
MKTLMFRPYADKFIQLLTKYVVDRNDTVSASYCSSMGYLLRLASDDRVLKTIDFAKNLYLNAEDVTPRVISGEILYSASKLSNDRFMAFAATALPFVFVCKHDGDEHVREQFEKTWQDNVGGSRAVTLYIREIVGLVSDELDAQLDLPTAQLVWPVLERALAGKTWEGKEAVLKALIKFSSQAQTFWQAKELSNLMKVSGPISPLRHGEKKRFGMLMPGVRRLRCAKRSALTLSTGRMAYEQWARSQRYEGS